MAAQTRAVPLPVAGAVAAGAAVLAWLVLRVGWLPVAHAAAALGWRGFLAVVVFHLGLIAAMGHAWWLLGPSQASPRAFVIGRFVRDSAAEALPLSQLGGFVIGDRALVLCGANSLFAAASTLVDLTVEMLAKLPYTVLGILLLRWQAPSVGTPALLLGVAIVALPAVAFVLLQARGVQLVERLAAALTTRMGAAWPFDPGTLRQEIARLYRRRLSLCGALAIHSSTWLLSAVELWFTLRLMGHPIGLASAVVIDSLLNGLRSFAFAIPGALGVQEAGYVALGALFALPPEAAIALSFLRRGRDLAIGIPGVLTWQLVEGGRLRRAARK